MPIVREDVLRTLAFDIFSATGVPVEDARIVADHLVNSHMAGHDSHGTWFLPGYARSMKKGYVPWEDREIVRENPSLTILNGKGGNGIVAVTRAVDLAVEKARSSTFGSSAANLCPRVGSSIRRVCTSPTATSTRATQRRTAFCLWVACSSATRDMGWR